MTGKSCLLKNESGVKTMWILVLVLKLVLLPVIDWVLWKVIRLAGMILKLVLGGTFLSVFLCWLLMAAGMFVKAMLIVWVFEGFFLKHRGVMKWYMIVMAVVIVPASLVFAEVEG